MGKVCLVSERLTDGDNRLELDGKAGDREKTQVLVVMVMMMVLGPALRARGIELGYNQAEYPSRKSVYIYRVIANMYYTCKGK